jgi:hypothetical protein
MSVVRRKLFPPTTENIMNIIPFDSGSNLPSFLKKVDIAALNADLTAHAGGGFPVISIKGKVFAVVRDGERELQMNPKDPDSAATSLNVVLLKVNKGTSKVFYIKGYDKDTSEGQKPDCYSNDGVEPAADSQNKQAKKCATCAHNQWGSRISERGATKGKACADAVRMAVAPAGQLNDAMLLRIPPASIKALGEYGQMLAKRGVGYNMVVTKVGFDLEAESPKLTFSPVGLLDDEGFAEVQEIVQSDIVSSILGSNPVAVEFTPTEEVEEAPAPKAAPKEEAPAPKAEAKPKAAAKPKAEPKPAPVEDDLDLDLDGISFDD